MVEAAKGLDDAIRLGIPIREVNGQSFLQHESSQFDNEIGAIFPELAEPSRYPIEAVPKEIRDAVLAIQEGVQAPIEIIANSILASIGLAIQPHYDIKIDHRILPPFLFLITIAESGERKSAADKLCIAPVQKWQQTALAEFKKEKQAYELAISNWKKKVKESNLADYSEIIESFGPKPSKPRDPRKIITDPTIESIGTLYSDGCESLGLFSDEGARLLGGYSMQKDNKLKNLAALSKLWDGSPEFSTRKGSGTTEFDSARFNLHLMLQPVVAQNLLNDDLAINQGFLPRCLISYPLSNMGKRKYKNYDIMENKSYVSYSKRITEILDRKFTYEDGKLNPKQIHLTEDALSLFAKIHDSFELRLTSKNQKNISGFISKASEYTLRLALVLEAFTNKDLETISLDNLNNAQKIVDYHLSETLRIIRNIRADQSTKDLMDLDKFLKNFKKDKFRTKNIYQLGPQAFRTKDNAEKGLQFFEAHQLITRLSEGAEIDGIKVRDGWRLGPLKNIQGGN